MPDLSSIFAKKEPRGHKITQLSARAQPVNGGGEVLVATVQGIPVGSKEEARNAMALDYLKVRYRYQASVDYGRKRAGGQVLDFLCYTPIRYTILDVRGVYWHTGIHEDSLSIDEAAKKHNYNLLVIWDYQCPSVEAAISFLRSHLAIT
jgi:hypothetical protein